jgi:hypothetical protein
VREAARHVTVWAPAAVIPLLSAVPGIDRLLPLDDGTPQVDYDVDVELMELPYVFRTTLATIPARVPYLTIEAASLPGEGTPRVGLVWRAGEWDTRRSIPFDIVASLLATPNVTWFALQHGVGDDERHSNLCPLDTEGLLPTARYMRALDLVISIDSMPAHLAGALGVPVWTLLPCEADWRWMERREDSPWYPTMRLFRQTVPGDWTSALAAVRRALARELHS